MFVKKPVLVLAAAVLTALAANANAQTVRHRHHPPRVAQQYAGERPPLTVNRRSFLDPGPIAPAGSMTNYIAQNTYYSRTPDQYFLKGQFGNEVLPQPLEVPGRPQPIIEWETLGYPY